eukprot:647740-Rhodomonas_salina.5
MVLPASTNSSTDSAYGAPSHIAKRLRSRTLLEGTHQVPPYAMSGTSIPDRSKPNTRPHHVRQWHSGWCLLQFDAHAATPCPHPPISLRARYALSGTDLGYAATRCSTRIASASADHTVASPISLRTHYAKSGTDLGLLPSPYALATRCPRMMILGRCMEPGGARAGSLSCYALALRCPVLKWRLVLLCYALAIRYPY